MPLDGTEKDRTSRQGWIVSAKIPILPQPQNVTLAGNRVFADAIRSCRIKSNDWCIFKRNERDYHRYREDSHVNMEAEMGLIMSSSQGMPGGPEELGQRHGVGSTSVPPRGMNPAGSTSVEFWPPEL